METTDRNTLSPAQARRLQDWLKDNWTLISETQMHYGQAGDHAANALGFRVTAANTKSAYNAMVALQLIKEPWPTTRAAKPAASPELEQRVKLLEEHMAALETRVATLDTPRLPFKQTST